jgi:SAM-dependent methyltransferase
MNIKKWACLMEIQQLFGEPHLQFTKEYILLLEQFAPSDSYKRLLDIGCGEGPEEINLLAQKGYEVTGISVIPWMAEKNPLIKIMDMLDMQFQPGSFDAGYSCAVMEHCYAPWLSCLEIWITLRDSGIFFMLIPIPTMYRVVTHPNLLSQDQWGFILQHTGFRVTHNEVHTILNTPLIVIVAQKDKPKEKIVQQVLDKLTKIRLGGK